MINLALPNVEPETIPSAHHQIEHELGRGLDGAFALSSVLVAVHWIPLILAGWLWPFQSFKRSAGSIFRYALSLISWIVVLICVQIFTDDQNHGGSGSAAAWYLIFSMMSLGVVPILTISIHIFAGRFAGYYFHKHHQRQSHHYGA